MHAFCLICLKIYFRSKLPGDTASCPVCRRKFQIPLNGVDGLPHHFIVQQLLELNNLQESSCDKHKDKQVLLYCHDCEENICLTCLLADHKNHTSVEIPEVADNFRLRIGDDDEQILSTISSICEQSGQTKQDAREFISKVEDVKKRVLATGDVVKRSVDDQVNDVLMKLESATSESSKEAESVQEAYQQAVVYMDNFHSYSQRLLDRGRPSDITQAACELHNRTTELLSMSNDVSAVKYHPPHVTFTPADVMQVKRLNVIGKLTVTSKQQPGKSYPLCLFCQ